MNSVEFLEKARRSLRGLFNAAQENRELDFAFALIPEQRGLQDAGWNSADDLQRAFDEYIEFLNNAAPSRMKIRIALAFYCHLAEASGYYEIPKNMLRIADGLPHVLRPFNELVREHKITGNAIAPNANKILKDLAGHSKMLGFDDLSEVFRDAFDSDLRNGYAHADYVVWDDGVRLPQRSGGLGRKIEYAQFHEILNSGIGFFEVLRELTSEYVESYSPAKIVRASLGGDPEEDWQIEFDAGSGTFYIGTPKR